jgi:NTP pyrophosphatase (non-canonical NTP hydrolase)
MTNKEYFDFVLSKLNPEIKTDKEKLLNSLLGLSGETGEIQDYFKKVMFQGQVFEKEHVLNECGDILFYLTLLLGLYGYDLQDAIDNNIDKLNKRYKNSFTVEESLNRVN